MRSISAAISGGSSAGCGRTRRYCAVKSYAGSSIALVQAQEERNSAALLFELLDRQPADECRIVHEALVVGAEEIARHRAARGLVSGAADKQPEIGVERDGGLGQQTPHRIGRDVGMVLELMPHGELRRVIGAKSEGGDDIEADVAVAVGVEQFGRELAEPQALPDVPFRDAEAGGDRLDRLAHIDQGRHGDELVRR